MPAKRGILDGKGLRGIIYFLMAVVLLVAGYASWKQYERHGRIRSEVEVLEIEKERIRRENESLKERIDYFATENFQEQESKERLNMRKDNEYVVDIERFEIQENTEAQSEEQTLQNEEPLPNYKKWWIKIF